MEQQQIQRGMLVDYLMNLKIQCKTELGHYVLLLYQLHLVPVSHYYIEIGNLLK
jgi:hypothetical protein